MMTEDASSEIKRSRRISGSERRRKPLVCTFRLSPEEAAELAAAADQAGLSVGSYVRGRLFDVIRTQTRRRPSIELQTIAKLQAEMNRVGGNIHQILKRVNFGETPLAHEFHQALAGYREVVEAILEALGRKRSA